MRIQPVLQYNLDSMMHALFLLFKVTLMAQLLMLPHGRIRVPFESLAIRNAIRERKVVPYR